MHEAKYDSTVSGDYNNVAPRVGFAWQPPFAPKRRRARRLGHLLRADRRQLQARPAALGAVLLLSERAGAARTWPTRIRGSTSTRSRFRSTCGSRADANGAPRWLRADGTPFPATSSRSRAKSNTFIDPLLRTPYIQQWTTNVQYELRRGLLLDLGYVGSRGTGLLGKINLAVPGRSARDAGQRLHRHLRSARPRDQPGLLRARPSSSA